MLGWEPVFAMGGMWEFMITITGIGREKDAV